MFGALALVKQSIAQRSWCFLQTGDLLECLAAAKNAPMRWVPLVCSVAECASLAYKQVQWCWNAGSEQRSLTAGS